MQWVKDPALLQLWCSCGSDSPRKFYMPWPQLKLKKKKKNWKKFLKNAPMKGPGPHGSPPSFRSLFHSMSGIRVILMTKKIVKIQKKAMRNSLPNWMWFLKRMIKNCEMGYPKHACNMPKSNYLGYHGDLSDIMSAACKEKSYLTELSCLV